jgi:hypothetical protein
MSTKKLRQTLALALAGGSLAIGVPAALAATGGGDAAPSAPASSFIQDEGEQARPDREDCPEKDGRGGGANEGEGQGGSAEQGGSTAEPSV